MNIYFLNDTYPFTKYYAEYFYKLDGIASADIDAFFFADTSAFNLFMQSTIMPAIKTQY